MVLHILDVLFSRLLVVDCATPAHRLCLYISMVYTKSIHSGHSAGLLLITVRVGAGAAMRCMSGTFQFSCFRLHMLAEYYIENRGAITMTHFSEQSNIR